MTGGEQRLDAHILVALRDALIHAVRNAIAHGIETPSERVAAGNQRHDAKANRFPFAFDHRLDRLLQALDPLNGIGGDQR